MTTYTATITKIANAQPMGEYKPTDLDARKAAATLRLIQCGPRVVRSKIELAGRGVKKITDGTFQLSDAAWDKVSATHTWECDF
jgi:hypothetical protein